MRITDPRCEADRRSAEPSARRGFVRGLCASLLFARTATAIPSEPYPASVAGIPLPRTRMCTDAHARIAALAPPFLVNHSLRTYVFGALSDRQQGASFDHETAFIAALLHDVGLLAAIASPERPFELDGADYAQRFVHDHGGAEREGARVWGAIAMHDMRFAFAQHESPEAMVVASGAAADVVGPEQAVLSSGALAEILAAFPRLDFKQRFTKALAAHCERKPRAQRATWLEGFCRAHATHPPLDGTQAAIAAAPFPD